MDREIDLIASFTTGLQFQCCCTRRNIPQRRHQIGKIENAGTVVSQIHDRQWWAGCNRSRMPVQADMNREPSTVNDMQTGAVSSSLQAFRLNFGCAAKFSEWTADPDIGNQNSQPNGQCTELDSRVCRLPQPQSGGNAVVEAWVFRSCAVVLCQHRLTRARIVAGQIKQVTPI